MADKEFFGMKYDVVFKAFFENKDNEDLLKNFLESLLDFTYGSIKEVEIKNPEIPVSSITDKYSRLDMNLRVDDRNINVEMQIKQQEYYKERAVYYWATLYDDLSRGESYGKIPDAIAIHILDHKLFDCKDFQSTFTFMEKKRHEILTNRCALHFFELPKITDKLDNNRRKELWLQFIKADSEAKVKTILKSGDDLMKKAANVIYSLQSNKALKEQARIRRKAQNDFYNDMTVAHDKGRAEGRAEGEQKLSSLVTLLLTAGRNEDLARLQDKDALKALYDEFGIW